MAMTIEAVYEDGVFKPLAPVKLENGQKVQVYVPWAPSDQTPGEGLRSWLEFQKSLAEMSDEQWAEFEKTLERGE